MAQTTPSTGYLQPPLPKPKTVTPRPNTGYQVDPTIKPPSTPSTGYQEDPTIKPPKPPGTGLLEPPTAPKTVKSTGGIPQDQMEAVYSQVKKQGGGTVWDDIKPKTGLLEDPSLTPQTPSIESDLAQIEPTQPTQPNLEADLRSGRVSSLEAALEQSRLATEYAMDKERAGIRESATGARTQAKTVSDLSKSSMADLLAQQGLSGSGAAPQGELGQNIARQGAISDITGQELSALQDVGTRDTLASQQLAQERIEQMGNIESDSARLAIEQQIANRGLDIQERGMDYQGQQLDQQAAQFAQSLDLDYARMDRQDQQFYKNLATQQNQFEQSIGLDREQLSQQDKQFFANLDQQDRNFLASLEFDMAQFKTTAEQFNMNIALDEAKLQEEVRQFNTNTDYNYTQLAESIRQYDLGLANDVAQFNTDLAENQFQFDSDMQTRAAELEENIRRYDEGRADDLAQNNARNALAWARFNARGNAVEDKKGFESFNSGVNSLLDAGDFTYALDIVNQNASNLTGAELDEFRTTIQNRRNGWESDTTHPNVAQRN